MTRAFAPGSVAFVGAGPGAADLITLRGAERLRNADVVLFDALADPALRALAPNARWIDVGKRVVRLKGGDPSVFGRLEEELAALAAAGIECEVVPGVTAALAAAASTRRPLTRRGDGRSVALTTAVTRDGKLGAGRHADTEVFYMAGKQLAALARKLVEAGWPATTPALVVSRAGWPDELASEHSVASLAEATLLHSGRPTVVTIGVGAEPIAAGARRARLVAESVAAEEARAAP